MDQRGAKAALAARRRSIKKHEAFGPSQSIFKTDTANVNELIKELRDVSKSKASKSMEALKVSEDESAKGLLEEQAASDPLRMMSLRTRKAIDTCMVSELGRLSQQQKVRNEERKGGKMV
jgi:hypothetical protein